MIAVELLFETIKLALLTGYLEGEKPVSLLIVSDRPESGKTEIIKKFNGTKNVALISDATAFGIWRDFHTELAEGKIKHLLFPDFLTALSRQKTTVDSLITTLNALVEEGLAELHTGFLRPINIASPQPVGVILAMIRKPFENHKKRWIENGFLSRLLIVSYRYSDKTVKDIFKSILTDEYRTADKFGLIVPEETRLIDCPLEMGAELKKLMDTLRGQGENSYGFRMLKALRRLAMASALADRREVVAQQDVDKVTTLSTFFNEHYEELS